jgi:hypothetical protein
MNPQDRRQNCKQAFDASEALSLSPAEGERAGVRGKNRDSVDQIHAQCFDGTPHPAPFQAERESTTEVWSILRTRQ